MNVQKQLLIELRSNLVGMLHTQPFTIYNDKTINALLVTQPKTLAELSNVKGFPKEGKRIKGFGESIVAIFTNGEKIQEFTINRNGEEVSVGVTLRKINAF